jgi:hypothetical protein
MFRQLHRLRQHCLKKRANTLLLSSSCAVLLLLFSPVSLAIPAFAQAITPDPSQVLTEEIKSLAHSDVENDIPRRTNFIVQIYSPNSAKLTPSQLSRVYDEEYSEKISQKNLKNAFIILGGITLLGVLAIAILRRTPKFKVKKVSTSLPFGLGQVEMESDEAMRIAAWALYVELTTRITTQALEADQGLLREALNSLYSLFASTRQILREAGSDVGTSLESVGGIAIAVLNVGLRPFLTKWHPALSAWETQRPSQVGPKEHEKNWSEEPQLRNELNLLRENLQEYVCALEKVIEVRK